MYTEYDVAVVRHVVQRILVPCVFVIGLLGNSVSIYVLTRKRMRCTTNIYLTALAITDIIYLTMALLLSLKHYEYVQRYFETYWRMYGIVVWLCDACAYISIYIAVSFTIERFIAIRYPLKLQTLCTEALAKKVLAGVALFCLLSTISTAFEHQYRSATKLIDSHGRPCNETLANKSTTSAATPTPTPATLTHPADAQSPPPLAAAAAAERITTTMTMSTTKSLLDSNRHQTAAAVAAIASGGFWQSEGSGGHGNDNDNDDVGPPKPYVAWPYADAKDGDSAAWAMEKSVRALIDVGGGVGRRPTQPQPVTQLNEVEAVAPSTPGDNIPSVTTAVYGNHTSADEFSGDGAIRPPEITTMAGMYDVLNVQENYIKREELFEGDPDRDTKYYLFEVREYCENITYYRNTLSDLALNATYTRVWFFFTFIVFVLIPLCLLGTFNCFLIMLVRRSRSVHGQLTNASSIRRATRRPPVKSSVSQENRVTITLIAVVLLFIVCQLPWAIYLIVSEQMEIDRNVQAIIGNIFNFLAALNAAANFFLYCVLSDKYRKTVRELITGYKYRPQLTMYTTTRSSQYAGNAASMRMAMTATNGNRRSYRTTHGD